MNKPELIFTINKDISDNSIELLNKYKIPLVRLSISYFEPSELIQTILRLKSCYHGSIQIDLASNFKGRVQESSCMIVHKNGRKYLPAKVGDVVKFAKDARTEEAKGITGTIFPQLLTIGDKLLFSDDEIVTRVIKKDEGSIQIRVESIRNVDGFYPSLGYVSPNRLMSNDCKLLSNKDVACLNFLRTIDSENIRQLTFSFIRDGSSAYKAISTFKLLGFPRSTKLILKIETLDGIKNLDLIIKCLKTNAKKMSFGLELGRGDLGVEANFFGRDLKELETIFIKKAKTENIDFIIATHIFDSAIENLKNNQEIIFTAQEEHLFIEELAIGAFGFLFTSESRRLSLSDRFEEFILAIDKVINTTSYETKQRKAKKFKFRKK